MYIRDTSLEDMRKTVELKDFFCVWTEIQTRPFPKCQPEALLLEPTDIMFLNNITSNVDNTFQANTWYKL